MIDRQYFGLNEIRQEWGISRDALLYYVENELLNVKVRIFGAFGKVYIQKIKKDITCELLELTGLFLVKLSILRNIILYQQEFTLNELQNDDYEKIELINPILLTYDELVITSNEKDRFETAMNITAEDKAQASMIADVRKEKIKNLGFSINEQKNGHSVVIYKDKKILCGPIQTKIIKKLYDAYCDGTEWVNGKVLLSMAGSRSIHMQDVFRRHELFKELIVGNKTGWWRLAFE